MSYVGDKEQVPYLLNLEFLFFFEKEKASLNILYMFSGVMSVIGL